MKILFITPYITSSVHPAFLRNQTGFGYMVHDIAQYVAEAEDVNMYIPMAFTPEMNVDGFTIIGRSKWTYIKSLRFRNLLDGWVFNKKYKKSFKSFLRSLYIFGAISQVERIMRKYDLVHIHGCSELTDAAIKACKRQNIPFLVTLHGLNSFEVAIRQNEEMRRYERDFLKEAVDNHYPVSFISTGNMQTAEASTGMKADSFHVICNGCDVQRMPMKEDIRSKYGISSDDFVFVFVGNVSVNKNQLQVARAWNLLPKALRQKCKVLFVGRYNDSDELVQYIHQNDLEDKLILCGIQPKEKVSDYYQACDATILTSLTEGFGLSIIEGFVYGKPSVTFSDLPAIVDIYDARAIVLSEGRSDDLLAQAMADIMKMVVDCEYIKKYSLQFSFDKMAERYRELFKGLRK